MELEVVVREAGLRQSDLQKQRSQSIVKKEEKKQRRCSKVAQNGTQRTHMR